MSSSNLPSHDPSNDSPNELPNESPNAPSNDSPKDDPKISEPPTNPDDLYGIGGSDRREPEDESARLAQIPKDHFIEPPKEGESDLYAFGDDQLGRTVPDAEALRHQMPKEQFFEAPTSNPDELYGVSAKNGADGPTDEKIRADQMPKEHTITPTTPIAPEELYAVSAKEDSVQAQGPDLRVLFAESDVPAGEVYGIGTGDSPPPSQAALEAQLPHGISLPPAPNEEASGEKETIAPQAASQTESTAQTESASSTESAAKAEPTATTESAIESPADSPVQSPAEPQDVYGVSAPVETHYARDVLRPGHTYEDPDEKYGKIAGNADLEGEVSLELIYGRRQEHERASMFDPPEETEEEPHVEKSALPKHPYVKGVFRPFLSPGFLLRILMMTFASLVPFYPGTYLFSRMVAEDENVQAAAEMEPEENAGDGLGFFDRMLARNPKIDVFFACLYEARIILFLVCFVWGVFAIPYYLHVFSATAAGDDRIDEWPELNMMGGIGQFIWLILLVFFGGIPGYLLFSLFDYPIFGFILGAIFLSPMIFLSCMETDTLFTPISANIFRSFSVAARAWRRFYIISMILYILAVCIMTLLLWEIVWMNEENRVSVFAVSFQIALLFSILPVIYLRYLGRLAWVIQEQVALARRKKEEQ